MERQRGKAADVLDILIYSINFVTISCALGAAAMLFKASLAYILFFASNVYVVGRFWEDLRKKAGRGVSCAVFLCSLAVFCLASYFVWREIKG